MYLDRSQIENLITEFERDTKAMKQELLKLSWYMRGGLNYNDAFLLSVDDRELISKLIEENLKITKDSGLPFF